MIRTAAAFAFGLACLPAAASAEPPDPGVYGNVLLSEESGDLGGAELELIGSGADARVELVICEGWCNSVIEAPVRASEDSLFFEFNEDVFDQNGAPVKAYRYEAVATRVGNDISLTVVPTDPGGDPFTFHLPQIDERFGLKVARED